MSAPWKAGVFLLGALLAACPAPPKPGTCGDATTSNGEGCDDGNTADGDGCAASCTVEAGFACSGAPSLCASSCGDGITAGAEGCDDGASSAGDGCSATCVIEPGFSCAGAPSVCAAGCGDGALVSPEQCDDGNLGPGDGCSAACAVERGFTCSGQPSVCAAVCGDSVVASGERCDDGNAAAGDGCAPDCTVEAGFTCAGAPSRCQTGCGDGAVVGLEQCDDANASGGDGCTSCQVDTGFACTGMPSACGTTCGDGTWGGPETCDDGNVLAGDGCSASCQIERGYACTGARSLCAPRCGDLLLVAPEACDDGNTTPNDGCNASCTPETGWTCSGAPSVCVTTCGDGVRVGPEACDDANAVPFDGCDSACRVDLFDELEPNGTLAQANGPFPVNSMVRASIRPLADDVDLFRLTLATVSDLTLETFDESGPGRCLNLDTVVTLYGPGGVVTLGSDDDSGLSRCSKLSSKSAPALRRLPPGNYIVEVRAYAAYRQIPEYRLVVTTDAACGDMRVEGSEACDGTSTCTSTCSRVPTCGDGFVDGAEGCDDGNTAAGDGCGASCSFEPGAEVEPNDTAAQASGPFFVDALLGGAITPAGDRDLFAITLVRTADVKLETFDATGPGSCVGIDTVVTLLGPDGTTVLATRDQGGLGNCGAIDPSRPGDAAARQLPAGTYFVRVNEFLDDGLIPAYRLRVTQASRCGNGVQEGFEACDGASGCTASCARVPSCGDGFVDSPEACDDGNARSGDGCSATCVSESVAELEPNNTAAQAGAPLVPFAQVRGSISPATDLDFFAIAVPAVSDLAVETLDPTGLCLGIDTTVTLLAPDGVTVLLTKTGGGVGSCASIDPKTDVPARQLAPGTYFVRVEDAGRNTVIASYVVRARFESRCGNSLLEGFEACDGTAGCTASCRLVATCGNGFVESGETCDDGNASPNDGCSATCAIERSELEPNNTTADVASATPLSLNGWAQGAITAGDVDTWRVVVPSAQALQLETFDATSSGCSIATTLRLLDATGVEVLADDNSGIAGCSALTAVLPAGTWFVQVQARTPTATLGQYLLALRSFSDRGAESEPNELRSTATMLTGSNLVVLGAHQANLDLDVFGITVPGGRSLRVELIEGGGETCESNGIDSYLTLFSASGLALGWDDDAGRGLCSRIDGTGAVPASPWASQLPEGTYYLQVEAAPFAQMASDARGQFDYRLVISIR